MRRPFANNHGPLPATMPSNIGADGTPSHIGSVAPGSNTVGVRRDFSFTPLYLPNLTITGGLKQPPRG
jgi:hypothetical protein